MRSSLPPLVHKSTSTMHGSMALTTYYYVRRRRACGTVEKKYCTSRDRGNGIKNQSFHSANTGSWWCTVVGMPATGRAVAAAAAIQLVVAPVSAAAAAALAGLELHGVRVLQAVQQVRAAVAVGGGVRVVGRAAATDADLLVVARRHDDVDAGGAGRSVRW